MLETDSRARFRDGIKKAKARVKNVLTVRLFSMSSSYEELLLIIIVIPEKLGFFRAELGLFLAGERGRPCA